MGDDMTTKEALFALDTDFDQDVSNMVQEYTILAIKHINSTPELYNYIKGNLEYGMSIKDSATTWAHNHNQEFGDLFITELDIVDWEEVKARV